VYQQQKIRFGPAGGITPAVKLLLIANAAVFFLQFLAPDFLVRWFALWPYLVWSRLNIWQLVTYMFLHGGFMHILFNMFALWMFGCQIEKLFGRGRFLRFYFFTGIAAGLTHLIFMPTSMVPVIGASGATYGILLAFALYFPDTKLFIFPFVFTPIKAKYLVLIVGAIAFFGSVSAQGGSGIAHLAHLGGMVFAYFYIRRLRFLNDIHYLIQQVRQRWLRKKYKLYQGGNGEDRTPGGFPKRPPNGDDNDFTVH
jgi:membrane associated rhomboid family serine protease